MENETLWILVEECAEVAQAASKCARFGYGGVYPAGAKQNSVHLQTEVGDLLALVDILVKQGVLDRNAINDAKNAKLQKLKIWSGIGVHLLDA